MGGGKGERRKRKNFWVEGGGVFLKELLSLIHW